MRWTADAVTGVTVSDDEPNRMRLPLSETTGVTVSDAEAWMTLATAATREGATDSDAPNTLAVLADVVNAGATARVEVRNFTRCAAATSVGLTSSTPLTRALMRCTEIDAPETTVLADSGAMRTDVDSGATTATGLVITPQSMVRTRECGSKRTSRFRNGCSGRSRSSSTPRK